MTALSIFSCFGFFSAHANVHEGLECNACHLGEKAKEGGMPPANCVSCHEEVGNVLKNSPHGQAFMARFKTPTASCLACHGDPHEILSHQDPNSKTSRVNQPATCGACHEHPSEIPPHLAKRMPIKSYFITVHGETVRKGNLNAASCADCHGSHDIRPPGDPASRISHGQIVTTCGQCHQEEAKTFGSSVHGLALTHGMREAPTCTDCHGEHTIRFPEEIASSVWKGAITKTCSGCHSSEKIAAKFGLPIDRVQTFLDSFHGLAGQFGDLKVANCASCHGWHDVLPSSDPNSRIHPQNISQTCGQCHPHAGVVLTSGKIHTSLSKKGEGSSIAGIIRSIYLILIPLLIAAMFLHNLADFLRKALARTSSVSIHEDEILLTSSERLQHGGLVLSFVLLAYSGFALEYANAWWALPFQLLGGEETRRNIHRVAAFIFILVSFFHIWYLFLTKEGRTRFRAILPERRDLSDPFKMILFNLGLRRERPILKRFSYIEKAEYWALVWGSMIMVLTGALLFFHNFALTTFPLWVIEVSRVIHFLEAVLATLAIVVWHFYWVLFDPDVYPMNWAWLTGRKKRPPK